MLRRIILALALLVAMVAAFGAARIDWTVFGIDDVWVSLFGPPDLGAVDFPTLRRRTTPNDALVCPRNFCANAVSDVEAPEFDEPAATLRARIERVALKDGHPRAEKVFAHVSEYEDRYVLRSKLMMFPDTVNVLVIERGADRSTLALYSRSQIGRGDMGVNRARLERWLAELAAR